MTVRGCRSNRYAAKKAKTRISGSEWSYSKPLKIKAGGAGIEPVTCGFGVRFLVSYTVVLPLDMSDFSAFPPCVRRIGSRSISLGWGTHRGTACSVGVGHLRLAQLARFVAPNSPRVTHRQNRHNLLTPMRNKVAVDLSRSLGYVLPKPTFTRRSRRPLPLVAASTTASHGPRSLATRYLNVRSTWQGAEQLPSRISRANRKVVPCRSVTGC